MNIADETLSLNQVKTFMPIITEASRLQDSLFNGGALHIILEDGNYGDDHVAYCVDFIESGAYAKEGWCEHKEIDAQLAFARALVPLTEQQREMVCEGKTATERLFDLCNNLNIGTYDEVIAAEAALERLYLARKALLSAGKENNNE